MAAFNPLGGVEIDCELALDPSCNDASAVLDQAIAWLIGISATLFFIMLLVGGIMYLTSAGNEDQANKAKQTLTWAFMGLVVVVASWAALQFFVTRITG